MGATLGSRQLITGFAPAEQILVARFARRDKGLLRILAKVVHSTCSDHAQAARAGIDRPNFLGHKQQSQRPSMIRHKTDLVFVGLTVCAGILCYAVGGNAAMMDALRQGASLLLVVLPLLAGGLLIGGLIQQLVLKDKIAAWLGDETGLRGLLIATAAGALTPGGPLMVFPVVFALWTAGAEAGVLVTYIVAWSLLGFVKLLAWELPLMGADFALIRVVVCLPLPILAGILARRLSKTGWFKLQTEASK